MSRVMQASDDSTEPQKAGKRKTPEKPPSVAERFQTILRTFTRLQEDFFLDWIEGHGFPYPYPDPVTGADSLSQTARGQFTDEMFYLTNEYAYDTIVHLADSKKGHYVMTSRSGKEPNKNATLFGEIEDGPEGYVCPKPCEAEASSERQDKTYVRRLYGFNEPELARTCNSGGAVTATPEAKQLLGFIKRLRRAHVIQLGVAAAKADKKATIKGKHIKVALSADGLIVM